MKTVCEELYCVVDDGEKVRFILALCKGQLFWAPLARRPAGTGRS